MGEAVTDVTVRARAREAFLAVLAEQCNVTEASRAAGISRMTAYRWRDDDPEFAAAWADAEQQAADKLEAAAWKRATEEQSDRMLEILLKAHRPEKFVETRRTELTGKGGAPLLDTSKLTPDQLKAVASIRLADD